MYPYVSSMDFPWHGIACKFHTSRLRSHVNENKRHRPVIKLQACRAIGAVPKCRQCPFCIPLQHVEFDGGDLSVSPRGPERFQVNINHVLLREPGST